MKRLLFAFALATLALPGTAPAQSDDAQLRVALEAAGRGQPVAPHMASHPAYGWIVFASLRRDLASLPGDQAQSFLARYEGQAVAESFRAEWLRALHRRQDWAGIRAAWSPEVTNTTLRCIELDARQRLGTADATWDAQVQEVWRSNGDSLPDQCDGPFAALEARGALTPELRWERLELAAAEWNPGVMRAAARGLPADQQALAEDYAAFVQSPHERALGWPKTDRSRLVASHGLAQLGRNDPDAAEAQLPRYAQALEFDEEARGRVLYQTALWTVASYLPDSERRLNLVPASAYDPRLHEWRARDALARADWRAALAAIEKMGNEQRSSARWTWFEGRMHELLGDVALAQRLYASAATDPTFHGFLAADRLGQSYALCPLPTPGDASSRARVANTPAMVRSMALFRADRPGWATREWHHALEGFDDVQRRIAVKVAQDNGWFDRAVFGLGREPEERRLYELRFPLHYDAIIRAEAAKNGLDPAWVAAKIRAESTFNPNARSPADARGLMQVLPSTGAAVARRNGIPYGGANSLYDPATNIRIGTAYMAQRRDQYGYPYIASAAYNAGPTPTARWQAQRGDMDADIWIETISYRETREYVARVMAFSVIYDWRLNDAAVPLSERMHGRIGEPTRAFACPATTG